MKCVCLIDNKEFDSEKKLHSYISRSKKIKLSDYYYKFYPRKDLYTQEIIPFKNKQQYFSTVFLDRQNLINFLSEELDKSVQEETIKNVIKLRKEYKNLHFSPCTIEARTSILPAPLFVNHLGFSYEKICSDLGLMNLYNYSPFCWEENNKIDFLLLDTREQRPLNFDTKTIKSKLDFGDITAGEDGFDDVFIERKSLNDLIGTLSSGYERFKRELDRGEDHDCKVLVLVESPLKELLNFDKQKKYANLKISSNFICSRIRDVCQKYESVQFLFVKNREVSAKIIIKILKHGKAIFDRDIQWIYDSEYMRKV